MAEKQFGGDSTKKAAFKAFADADPIGDQKKRDEEAEKRRASGEKPTAKKAAPTTSATEKADEAMLDPIAVQKSRDAAADKERTDRMDASDKAREEASKTRTSGIRKETSAEAEKAARQDKKGATEASYSTNEGAKAAVEDVAESVAGTVSGAAPARTIKPAGRVEEMSLRQLRERERGAGVGGLLGTGGARGDVRRRMRQGTIQTEAGQEALGEFQEAREARQDAQQAKREARAVLRGGEYTPRTPSDPGGFRALAQDVAGRASAAGDVLTEAKRTTPKATPDPVNPYSSGDEGFSEDSELELSPVSRIGEEQFSEDPELALPPLGEEQFSEVPDAPVPLGEEQFSEPEVFVDPSSSDPRFVGEQLERGRSMGDKSPSSAIAYREALDSVYPGLDPQTRTQAARFMALSNFAVPEGVDPVEYTRRAVDVLIANPDILEQVDSARASYAMIGPGWARRTGLAAKFAEFSQLMGAS